MQARKIHILTAWDRHPNEMRYSNLASTRLRLAVAYENLLDRGCYLSAGEDAPIDIDILIVGKIGANEIATRAVYWLSAIRSARDHGTKIVLDYTDHHLGFDSPMNFFYKQVLGFTHICVTSSNALRTRLAQYFSGEIYVLPDPIEVPLVAPRTIKKIEKVLWFGHPTNAGYLISWLTSLPKTNSFSLRILTDTRGAKLIASSADKIRARVSVDFYEWSVRNMVDVSSDADLCVIPSDSSDPRKAGASSNRLLSALALGLPTAATPIPSYAEFSDYFVDIKSDPFSLSEPELSGLCALIKLAQANILEQYSREAVGRQWTNLFGL